MKKLNHIKLFEQFNQLPNIQSMLSDLKNDSEMGGYNLTLDTSDPETTFLVWNNPQEDTAWLNSGYAEDYDGDFSSVDPLYVLALINLNGQLYAYPLSPEEKYSKTVVIGSDESLIGQSMEINSLDDLKTAIHKSLWEMA